MKIGLNLPPTTQSPDQFCEWVRRVDTGPFSTLSVLDRLVYSNFEPLITLASAATLTTRVRLMTEILIAPIRLTAILAKESATLDVLSRGRLTLGSVLVVEKRTISLLESRISTAANGWKSNWSR